MARALADIMTELNSVYNPQRETYNTQLSSVDPQLAAEQKGLQAQKQDSFQQITDQANRRGLFYSGLPIAEEQRYVGQQFLPAVANLQAKYAQQRFGLQDALAKITTEQANRAQDIYGNELALDEQKRQFDAQQAAAAARDAASRAGSAAASFAPSFGGTTGGLGPRGPQPAASLNDQAYRNVQSFLSQGREAAESDYQATLNSANRGNALDKLKVQLYNRAGIGIESLQNRMPTEFAGVQRTDGNRSTVPGLYGGAEVNPYNLRGLR